VRCKVLINQSIGPRFNSLGFYLRELKLVSDVAFEYPIKKSFQISMFRVRIPPEHASKKTTGDRIPGDRMSTLSNSSPRGHHAVLISFSADEPVGNREGRGGGTSTNEVAEIPWLAGHLNTRGEVYHRPLLLHAYHPLLPFSASPARAPAHL